MIKKVLLASSYIFHPLFAGVYATAFYFWYFRFWFDLQELYYYGLQVVILTIFIPLTIYFLLVSLKQITSFATASIKERIIPLWINLVLLWILMQKSLDMQIMPGLYFFFFGALVANVFALLGIYLQVKASLHMMALTSLTTFILALSIHLQIPMIEWICLSVIVVGAVASSRILMKAHDVTELVVGGLMGIVSQLTFWKFWL